jgi:hypothetical protein
MANNQTKSTQVKCNFEPALLQAIRQHIDLPEKLISLEIRIALGECVTCKAEFYATKEGEVFK